MNHTSRYASLIVMCLLAAAQAHADTLGLRPGARTQGINFDVPGAGSGGLRFNGAPGSSSENLTNLGGQTGLTSNSVKPLQLDLQTASTLWADWYPLEQSGLRTSMGLSWHGYGAVNSPDLLSRPQAFLGLGWASGGSSSSATWHFSADVGASLMSLRDCSSQIGQCSTGLKPGSHGEGIRWNPFISIGASIQY